MVKLNIAVESAINKVINDFQANPERFWNERDIHWSLFYYIKQEAVVKESYPTQLIHAEFPTRKVFPGAKTARGHYDLVIINETSNNDPAVQIMTAQAPWQPYLDLIQLDVAIEIKIWQSRINDTNLHKLIDWDIKKLTSKPNNIKGAYFLNFVQLDFSKPRYRDFITDLRKYLKSQKKSGLNILCIPSDKKFQNSSGNWL